MSRLNTLAIYKNPLPCEGRLETRNDSKIRLVVIHCTELPDLETARQYGEKTHYPDSSTGNSGHYYIDRDGRIEEWVDPLRVAHHVARFNDTSVGIELVNLGRYPNWLHSGSQEMREPYPDEQITALLSLLNGLTEKFPKLKTIAGHEDLDRRKVPADDRPDILVHRKLDPGPMFPWDRVLDSISLTPHSKQTQS